MLTRTLICFISLHHSFCVVPTPEAASSTLVYNFSEETDIETMSVDTSIETRNIDVFSKITEVKFDKFILPKRCILKKSQSNEIDLNSYNPTISSSQRPGPSSS